MDAIGIRIVFKTAKWPENLKASTRRQADDVGRRLERRHARRRATSWSSPTARTRARPTRRASTCRPTTRPTSGRSVLPDGPERQAADRRGQAPGRRLHAVQGPRAPHLHRPRAALGRRLPTATCSWAWVGPGATSTSTRRAARGRGMKAAAMRLLGTACLRWRPLAAAAARRPQAATAEPKVLRYAFPAAETGFDPAQLVRPLLAHRHRRTSSRRCTATTTLARPFKVKPLHRGRHARGVGRLQHLDGAHQARHLLRRRPGLQAASGASWWRRTTCTRSSASPTRR